MLIEGSPIGLLNAALGGVLLPQRLRHLGFLGKIKEAHKKHPCFEGTSRSEDAFTVLHYPGKVTYDADRLPREEQGPALAGRQGADAVLGRRVRRRHLQGEGGSGRPRAVQVGQVRRRDRQLPHVAHGARHDARATKTHFIRCVKPNEKKAANTFVDDVMRGSSTRRASCRRSRATRKGFPDHLPFDELLNRFILIVDKRRRASAGKAGVAAMLKAAGARGQVPASGKTKVFLGVGVLDKLEQARMEFIAEKAVMMQGLARMLASRKQKLRARKEAKAEEERGSARPRRRSGRRRRRRKRARRRRRGGRRRRRSASRPRRRRRRKEAEEKERQERFRRARQLSFERKTAKKKREEGEERRPRRRPPPRGRRRRCPARWRREGGARRRSSSENLLTEARVELGGRRGQKPSEEYAKKLQTFQQDVAERQRPGDSEMMNVAVVSDIGWKNATGADDARGRVGAVRLQVRRLRRARVRRVPRDGHQGGRPPAVDRRRGAAGARAAGVGAAARPQGRRVLLPPDDGHVAQPAPARPPLPAVLHADEGAVRRHVHRREASEAGGADAGRRRRRGRTAGDAVDVDDGETGCRRRARLAARRPRPTSRRRRASWAGSSPAASRRAGRDGGDVPARSTSCASRTAWASA